MDLPKAPDDQELRNIIDKLAQFVARNGIEFEQMTKNKQKDNPKFSFLFGGEHFNYYQYKVTTEQAILKQKQKSIDQRQTQLVQHVITQQSIHSVPWQQNHLHQQHQEQIQQSERNLAAQHHVLMQQQQMQIDEEIFKAQEKKLQTLANECGVDLLEADKIMQPILDSCTKDSISAGKSWIFNHSSSSAAIQVIGRYLVKRITSQGATFDMKLHIVYLLNDVLHHCTRKNAEDLKRILEAYVVPIFCTTCIGASDEQQQKLAKLLRLWETNKYFDPNTIEANLITENANAVTPITLNFQSRYAALQKQHQDFVAHLTAQLQVSMACPMPTMDAQKSSAQVMSTIQPSLPHQLNSAPPPLSQPPPTSSQDGVLNMASSANSHVPVSAGDMMVLGGQPNTIANTPAPQINFTPTIPPPNFIQNFSQPPPGFTQPPPGFPTQYTQPPPNFSQPPPTTALPHFTPDLTKPPPGFQPLLPPGAAPVVNPVAPLPTTPSDLEQMIMPNVPYYELPAGLMTTLVKLEDCDYSPLDPSDLCLPPPQAPSERLLTAVELFYGPPSHDRPRNSDGWEQLGLYEFFKAKSQAKKKKEEEIREGKRPRSHSRSRSRERFRSRSRSPLRRRYREEVPPKPTVRVQPRSKSKSRSKSRSRSRSRSPVPLIRKSRSKSRSKSPVSPVPTTRLRRRSASPPRSPSPPSFFGGNYVSASLDRRLDENNRGHQLLKKMGWGGAGLGAEEQGMQDPISGGEVRDRQDQYKGVGITLNDPFENFRKSKGQAFINRMKARAEEKLSN